MSEVEAVASTNRKPKRALILAGGGMKVAWQAGVLQVLLEEARQADGSRLEFDIYDAASGGVFQLAMLCQGMSGHKIADNWRNVRPLRAVGINWSELPKLLWAESLLTLDNLEKNTWTGWGLDFEKIRDSRLDAGFNVYNFSEQRLEIRTPQEMDESWLRACVSLPVWFPKVKIADKSYIDSVFATDANLERAIEAGADELWVVWTVSELGEWRQGFLADYFQIIEASADSRYRDIRARIDRSNNSCRNHEHGEWNRQICVKEIKGEVPLHYLFDLSRDRFAYAVNMGVDAARTWCRANGYRVSPRPSNGHTDSTALSFTEEMQGTIAAGAAFFTPSHAADRAHSGISLNVTINIDNLIDYIQTPGEWASVTGWVSSPYFCGERRIREGRFTHFWLRDTGPDHTPNPLEKRMLYRLCFPDEHGDPLTLIGDKWIRNSKKSTLWHDTTTMYATVYRGEHLDATPPEDVPPLYTGVLHISLIGFLRQMATMRVQPALGEGRFAALTRFGLFFFGGLWDVYGRHVLDYGPW